MSKSGLVKTNREPYQISLRL